MHRVKEWRLSGIIDLLKSAAAELSAELLREVPEAEKARNDVYHAINDIERWEGNEIETEDITDACNLLKEALDILPDEASGEARLAIEGALTDLREEEDKAKRSAK